jgi:hypothetical protein
MLKVLTQIKKNCEEPHEPGYGDYLWNNDIIQYYPKENIFVKEDYLVWTFQEFCETLIQHKVKYCTSLTDYGDYWLFFDDPKEISCRIIWKYWKKYKFNVFKKRRDPLKKELMEYFYHPSRFIFFSKND